MTLARRLFPLVVSIPLLAVGTACDDMEEDDGHGDGDGHTGTEIPEPETYMPGMSKATHDGMFMVSLTSEPAIDTKMDYTWTLEIESHEDSNPIEGAEIVVTPWMTEHGHGISEPPQVTEDGEGMYTVTGVNLFMAGVWDTSVEITADGQTDMTSFVFEVFEE